MILITVLAWGATLWLDPRPQYAEPDARVYYWMDSLAWEAFAGTIPFHLMTQPRLVAAHRSKLPGSRFLA